MSKSEICLSRESFLLLFDLFSVWQKLIKCKSFKERYYEAESVAIFFCRGSAEIDGEDTQGDRI
jgi:hypothetical protein